MIKHITSKENSAVRLAAAVARGDRKQGLMLLEGSKLLAEAVNMGMTPDYIFVGENIDCTEYLNYNIYQISDSLMNKITDIRTPDGVCCLVRRPAFLGADKIEKGKYLAVDGLQDPKNMGAVYRIADAFSLDGVVLIGSNADPYSPKATRGSMGSNIRVKSFRVSSSEFALLREHGLKVYAAIAGKDAQDIRELEDRESFVIVIGNEGSGITEDIMQTVTGKIKIPMPGRTESLNAAVAAGIIIWELIR